jgi:hypothetical protein
MKKIINVPFNGTVPRSKINPCKKIGSPEWFQKEYEIAKSPAVYNTNRMYYYTIVRGTSNRMSDDRTFFYDPERNLAVLLTGGDFKVQFNCQNIETFQKLCKLINLQINL